ncbi:sodium transport system ATP-binding protein [Ruminococcaceae bacterium KH2T8]|nr:sodium transport system ATP-binding protein [Ruminococcaceae bacterium KH2T8]
MSSEVMISLKDIHKSYNKSSETIKGVSFEVTAGEVYGLLGPNGAGKTTLMQMISTLSSPTSGDITICGMSPAKDRLKIHEKIGFLTTEVKLDPLSTPDKLYDFFAALYNIDKAEVPARKQIAFERFGIHPFANKRIIELSTGMKQKVSIAISLIHEPPVIIFDEPTNGLDILTSKQVTDYLLELKDQGRAIILSTHIFSVAEDLCDRIGILVDGKIVAEGNSKELMGLTGTCRFEDAFFTLYKENHHE